MYYNRADPEPCAVAPSSIAAQRYRTKQHTEFGNYPGVSTSVMSSTANLQACQYATVEAKAWLKRELDTPGGLSDET